MAPLASTAELEARLEAATRPPVDAVARIAALNDLAWHLRGRDAPRAHALAAEARDAARVEGHAYGQARAARTMAMTIGDPDAWPLLFELAEEARRLFDQVGDPAGRAGSRDFLASLHEFIGDLSGGLDLALDALSIARELDDPVRQGYALSSVGGILAASGDADAAIAHLEEGLRLFESVEDPSGIGTILSRLSKVLIETGRLDEALGHAETCRTLAKAGSEGTDPAAYDDWLSGQAFGVMAEVERRRGRLHAAEGHYRSALVGLTSPPARNVLGAELQVELGRVLLEQGNLEAAAIELEDALGRVEGRSISIVTESAARSALAEVRERQGDLAETVRQLKEAERLRAQVAKREAKSKLAQVEARAAMEAARKDAEINELRFVELRRMQAKLVEAERMALLGQLAAGTAHELNTPLGVLRSHIQLVDRAMHRLAERVRGIEGVGAEVHRLVQALARSHGASEAALDRLGAVVESFRRFTHLDEAERETFDLRLGLASALDLLEPTLPSGVRFERRLGPVPAILGWPREVNHAFMTVLKNAVEAIDGGGVVTAVTDAVDGEVVVRVVDTGRGMSPEEAGRLFDVAWATEGSRTKMRLGLAAAWATVERHRGRLEVESAPGEGTTVLFRFPVRSEEWGRAP